MSSAASSSGPAATVTVCGTFQFEAAKVSTPPAPRSASPGPVTVRSLPDSLVTVTVTKPPEGSVFRLTVNSVASPPSATSSCVAESLRPCVSFSSIATSTSAGASASYFAVPVASSESVTTGSLSASGSSTAVTVKVWNAFQLSVVNRRDGGSIRTSVSASPVTVTVTVTGADGSVSSRTRNATPGPASCTVTGASATSSPGVSVSVTVTATSRSGAA